MGNETTKGHKKHANIQRPKYGEFGRFELGLIGAPCNIIKTLVTQIADQLKEIHTISYVDADHQSAERPAVNNLTDRISHDRIEFEKSLNNFDRKILLGFSNFILVNGNHFHAQKQIVICTEKKKESLEKKLDRLTDVGLIILDHDISAPHNYLKRAISNFYEIPVFKISQLAKISNWIREEYQRRLPQIKGLVLAGGKSERMGQPKAFLDYHGIPQVSHACQVLSESDVSPVISCRSDQAGLFNDRFPLLFDTFKGLGPYGAILSAFRSDPDSAWLVIACDQPLLSADKLKNLLLHRDASRIATCYHNPNTGFPEPLITLWEPQAYPRLLSFLSLGYSCPRKVLINSNINELKVDDTGFMLNANTEQERQDILHQLHSAGPK